MVGECNGPPPEDTPSTHLLTGDAHPTTTSPTAAQTEQNKESRPDPTQLRRGFRATIGEARPLFQSDSRSLPMSDDREVQRLTGPARSTLGSRLVNTSITVEATPPGQTPGR